MDENLNQEPEVVKYSWRAYEFKSTSRPGWWYLAAGGLLLLFIGYAVYTQEWIRLAVGVLLAVVIFLATRIKPREFDHSISDIGVRVGNRFYPYASFKSFSIVASEDGPKLILETGQSYKANLTLQLGSADVEKIRALLAAELTEEAREEDSVDKMNRMFKL